MKIPPVPIKNNFFMLIKNQVITMIITLSKTILTKIVD